jgi:hypothetical protein
MRGETELHLRFYYQSMAKHNKLARTRIVFVDKDLHNINFIKEYFPNAQVLLCVFHVLKYLKAMIWKEEWSKEGSL